MKKLVSPSQQELVEKRRLENSQEFLIKASELLFSSLEYRTTLNSVAKLIVPDLADWCTIDMITENDVEQLAVAHVDPKKVAWAKELRKSQVLQATPKDRLDRILKSSKSDLYPTIPDEMLVKAAKSKKELKLLRDLKMESVMVVKIRLRKEILGSISFISTQKSKQYTKQYLALAEELARRAAIAIDNARLYEAAKDELEIRKSVEEELRQSRNQLEIIFQNAADGITVQDQTGKLTYANDTAAHSSGFSSANEMLAVFQNDTKSKQYLTQIQILDETGSPFPLDALPGRRALKGEKDPKNIVCYVDTKTGKKSWVLIKARPVLGAEGNIELAVNIINDITERKELEQRKDEFISIASHELKTPVTSIKVFAQILQKRLIGKVDEQSYRLIQKMDTQLDKLSSLIYDLLDISKIQAGKLVFSKQAFSYMELVREVIDTIQPTTQTHRIQLFGINDLMVYGDKDRIGQVLINLLTNAIKYSPEADKIMISITKTENEVITSVQDFGMGIPKGQQSRIFERFYQVSDAAMRTYPGLGMGLYISQEIISRHEGTLQVKSTPKKGSTFSYTLPLRHT